MGNTTTKKDNEKPTKVNKWDTNAVKHALDDACKKFFKETLDFTQDHTVMDRRLVISAIACSFSLFALIYDWFNPFPKSRSVLIVCCISYFIVIGLLTLYIRFIERGQCFAGKIIDKTGLQPGLSCKINSKIKKYDDIYNLTLEYNDGVNTSSETLVSSVGNYFDTDGVLCCDQFTSDLKKIYDQARSNARKHK